MDARKPGTARWRKSSRSSDNANCVEVAHLDCEWRKSSYSTDQANCVEVAPVGSVMAVRDSKNTSGPVLTFPVSGWTALLSAMD